MIQPVPKAEKRKHLQTDEFKKEALPNIVVVIGTIWLPGQGNFARL
jgi:hypothetical protein